MSVSIFGHKGRYSKATMRKWTKTELIDYITICEHNERVAIETLEQQAKNFQFVLDNIKNYKEPLDGVLEKHPQIVGGHRNNIKWDRLYLYLNDWRLGVAPNETTDSNEVHDRTVIHSVLGEVMQVMEEMQGKERSKKEQDE